MKLIHIINKSLATIKTTAGFGFLDKKINNFFLKNNDCLLDNEFLTIVNDFLTQIIEFLQIDSIHFLYNIYKEIL